jgi:hypothetical protein
MVSDVGKKCDIALKASRIWLVPLVDASPWVTVSTQATVEEGGAQVKTDRLYRWAEREVKSSRAR